MSRHRERFSTAGVCWLVPWMALHPVAPAIARDCDGNGTEDTIDIGRGSSPDCNGNGIPDDCDLGPGSLGFPDAVHSEVSSTSPGTSLILLHELNGDGLLDAVTFEPRGLLFLRGDGAGAFLEPARSPMPGLLPSSSALAADLDGDGPLDVAVATVTQPAGRRALSILDGNGDGTFGEPRTATPADHGPGALAAADLDGDGAVDLAAVNEDTSTITPWWNDGTGSLRPEGVAATGSVIESIVAGDADGDGDADIVLAANGNAAMVLIRNQGGRTFHSAESVLFTGTRASVIRLADVETDGDLDAILGNAGAAVSVVRNEGGGAFRPFAAYEGGEESRGLAARDLDGDGFPDIATVLITYPCDAVRSSLLVLLGRGDATFLSGREWRLPYPPPLAMELGDVDGNGLLDVVLGRSPPSILALLGERGSVEADADLDGVPDSCAVHGHDCNQNGIPDGRDIADRTSPDCDDDGTPDECQPDCDRNGSPDPCDLSSQAADANKNGLLDACELELREDCNSNGVADGLDLAGGASRDCDSNGRPDECDVRPRFAFSFGSPEGVALDSAPGGAAQADFDGDGDLDVAVTTRGSCCATPAPSGSITILVNLGAGRLVHAGSHAPDADAALVTALDADGDGDLDLAALQRALTCRGPARALLLANDGRGSFHRGEGFALPADPSSAAAGDIDGDGDLDLAVGNDDPGMAAVSLFLAEGGGRFTPGGLAGPPGGPRSITGSDWDGDGDFDLAAALGTPDPLVLRNDGRGVFTASTVPGNSPNLAVRVIHADLDQDGDQDLITGDRSTDVAFSSPTVRVFANEGGSFRAFEEARPAGAQARWMLAGDWNDDGFLDVAVAGEIYQPFTTELYGAMAFLHGKGDGRLEEGGFFAAAGAPSSAAGGDLDGDGDLDVVLMDSIHDRADVFLNAGDRGFGSANHFRVGENPRSMTASDLDGDGAADLAIASEAGSLSIISGGGRTAGFSVRALENGVPPFPADVAAADLDLDGDSDLVVAGTSIVRIFRNGGVGAFTPGAQIGVGSNPVAVASADLDRDGDMDLVTGNSLFGEFSDNVTVFANTGSGAFQVGRNFAVGFRPVQLVISDMDGDGFEDIVTAENGIFALTILRNREGAGFEKERQLPLAAAPFGARAADVDGDGDSDLLVATDADGVLLFRNLGEGDLIRTRLASDGFSPDLEAADLDRDGDPDLVLSLDGSFSVSRNDGTGIFQPAVIFHVGPVLEAPPRPLGGGGSGDADSIVAHSIAAADLDGDADLDVALAFGSESTVIIALNEASKAQPDVNQNLIPDACETPSGAVFRRGDARVDGTVDMTDAVTVLRHLFVTGDRLACPKAADANDDARVDVSDAVAILRFLFLGHDAPAEPFPGCGADPMPDLLECAEYGRC